MRRLGVDENRRFKGSVFVEFVEKESADKFLSQETVKYEDVELTKESKLVLCDFSSHTHTHGTHTHTHTQSFREDYFNRKNEERKQKKSGRSSELVYLH